MEGNGFRFDLREIGGALGDLGTLLPLMLGSVAVAGLAPAPVVLGFGLSYVGTALLYRLPVPVQPMKAVAAVLLTVEVTASSLAASGVVLGAALLLLAGTGGIDRLGRLLPQSVLAGLQLGLGVALALVGLTLMAAAPWLGAATLVLLLVLLGFPRLPAALLAIGFAVAAAWAFGLPALPTPAAAGGWPGLVALPSWPELEQGVAVLALPQLALTVTNAILVTALVAGDYFGERARAVTPRRLAVSTGLGNLLFAPFGALPMCHGAGGLAAHVRFGARSGGAPLMLGLALIALALTPGAGLALLAAIPAAGLGALLLLASFELAASRRLWDCRPSCYPVIAATAAVTWALDPFWGLLAGTAAELARRALLRGLGRDA
jgi:MFS superfamily sulfate permease-like transporter